CSRCFYFELPVTRTETGKAICFCCYQNDRSHNTSLYEDCARCGKFRRVATRNDDGKPICQSCYQKNRTGVCEGCGHTKMIVAHKRCWACYKKQRRSESIFAIPA